MADTNDVLGKFIEDIKSGRKTAKECLNEYRDKNQGKSDDIEAYLMAAEELIRTCRVTPSPKRKQEAKDILLAAVEQKRWEAGIERKPSGLPSRAERRRLERKSARPKRFLTKLGVITLAFSIISGATFAMASESLPGNPLYPLKIAVENARIKMAKDDTTRSKLYLKAARTRMQELRKMGEGNEHYGAVAREAARDIELAEEISAKIPAKERKTQPGVKAKRPKQNLDSKPVKPKESRTQRIAPEKLENEIQKETIKVRKTFERDFKKAVEEKPVQKNNRVLKTTPQKATPQPTENRSEDEKRLVPAKRDNKSQQGRSKSSDDINKVPNSIPGVPDTKESKAKNTAELDKKTKSDPAD